MAATCFWRVAAAVVRLGASGEREGSDDDPVYNWGQDRREMTGREAFSWERELCDEH